MNGILFGIRSLKLISVLMFGLTIAPMVMQPRDGMTRYDTEIQNLQMQQAAQDRQIYTNTARLDLLEKTVEKLEKVNTDSRINVVEQKLDSIFRLGWFLLFALVSISLETLWRMGKGAYDRVLIRTGRYPRRRSTDSEA